MSRYLDEQEKAIEQLEGDCRTHSVVRHALEQLEIFCRQRIAEMESLQTVSVGKIQHETEDLRDFAAALIRFRFDHFEPWRMSAIENYRCRWEAAESFKEVEVPNE